MGSRRRFGLDIIDDVRVVSSKPKSDIRYRPVMVSLRPWCSRRVSRNDPGPLDLGVVAAVYSRVLASIRTVTATMSFGSASRIRA